MLRTSAPGSPQLPFFLSTVIVATHFGGIRAGGLTSYHVRQERGLGLFSDSLCQRGFLGIGARETLRFTSHERSFTELSERWYRRC